MKKYLYIMRFQKVVLFFIVFISIVRAHAAVVDTVETYSEVMHKTIKAVVVKPDTYAASEKSFPVVYLLHGYGDKYSAWLLKARGVPQLADVLQMIVVCPDGGVGSWYMDSPIDEKYQYETYVSKELVAWVDKNYHTVADRKGRAITGLSMGGHGALYLAFRHQDVYGAAGSMSGGVDIRPFPNNWEIARRLGAYALYPENWEKNSVINLVHLLTPNSLALMIECGTEDFFYKVNVNLHEKLMERNIPHDFVTRPGGHNWPYWTNAIPYQLLFMSRYFANAR